MLWDFYYYYYQNSTATLKETFFLTKAHFPLQPDITPLISLPALLPFFENVCVCVVCDHCM